MPLINRFDINLVCGSVFALLGFFPHWTLPQWTLSLFAYLHAWVYRLLCCWLSVLTNTHTYTHHSLCPLVSVGVTWGTAAWVLDSQVTRLSLSFIVKCVPVHRVLRANRGHRCSLSEKVFVCQYKMAVYCHNGLIECETEWAHSLYMTDWSDKTLLLPHFLKQEQKCSFYCQRTYRTWIKSGLRTIITTDWLRSLAIIFKENW